MSDESPVRRRAVRRKPRPASLGAAATEAAAASPPPQPPTVETITFQFTADRFGFDASPRAAEDEVTYAREALRALDDWADAIGALFGDIDRGLRAAGDAGILPYTPTWSSTLESRERVRDNLGTDSVPFIAAETDAPRVGNALIDQKTRDAVQELRRFLRMLSTWRWTFEAGLWIATIAARGSIEQDPERRLLQGLGAIAAVCEFDAIDTPDRILSELLAVAAHAFSLNTDALKAAPLAYAPGAQAPVRTGLPYLVAVAVAAANAALQGASERAVTTFVDKPALLRDWTDKLRVELRHHQHEAPLPADQWEPVESAYWRQWDWPTAGAVVRRETSVKMTVLDLLVAARHAGATFLHWRGGLLSIAQWSRILAIATPQRFAMMREAAEAALGQLGFAELIERFPPGAENSFESSAPAPSPSRNVSRRAPLVALSLLPKDSALALCRADPVARAFALTPRERHETDERIAHHGGEISGPSLLAFLIDTIRDEGEAARLHLIEIPPGPDGTRAVAAESWLAHTLGWKRVLFGAQPPETGAGRFALRSSARSIRELTQDVRRAFPELFPDAGLSPWLRWYTGRYRRFQQSRSYAFLRGFAVFQWLERWILPKSLAERPAT